MADLLLDRGANVLINKTPLLLASLQVGFNNAGSRFIKKLIAHEPDLLNEVDSDGFTPLITAVRRQSEAAEIFVCFFFICVVFVLG